MKLSKCFPPFQLYLNTFCSIFWVFVVWQHKQISRGYTMRVIHMYVYICICTYIYKNKEETHKKTCFYNHCAHCIHTLTFPFKCFSVAKFMNWIRKTLSIRIIYSVAIEQNVPNLFGFIYLPHFSFTHHMPQNISQIDNFVSRAPKYCNANEIWLDYYIFFCCSLVIFLTQCSFVPHSLSFCLSRVVLESVFSRLLDMLPIFFSYEYCLSVGTLMIHMHVKCPNKIRP